MYSSFKKQQLLTESWRKFLLEASEEELKYFGDWADENYLNAFSKKIMELATKNKQIDLKAFQGNPLGTDGKKVEISELSDDKLQFLGKGSFRAVFAPRTDKDFIIKFALSDGALDMNKSEATMVKGKDYQIPIETAKSDLLPKVFKTADDFSWIVIEKLNVIGTPMVFNQFFKPIADMFRQFGFGEQVIQNNIGIFAFTKKENPVFPEGVFSPTIILNNHDKEIFKEQILIPILSKIKAENLFADEPNIADAIEDYLENGRKEEIEYLLNISKSDEIVDLINNKFYEYAGQFPLIVKIRNLIKTYKIAPNEIRPNNTGYNSKGEFKLIDSSIEDQIQTAFFGKQSTNTNSAGSTF